MPRPAGVTRVVFSGTIPQGEHFAWGFWLNAAQGSQISTQATANAIAVTWNVQLSAVARLLIGADTTYDAVTVYSYETADAAATFVAVATLGPVAGTSVGAGLPLQCGIVATLRTGNAGRQNRGRLYLPVNAQALTAHQLTDPVTTDIAVGVAGLFTGINASATIVGSVCVVSSVGSHTTVVDRVSANSRLDIQRRRAASELELFDHTANV